MRFPSFLFTLSLLLASLTAQAQTVSAEEVDDPVADLYTVSVYDPGRDPAADLAATVAQAQAAGKRILLEIGGEWCSWCHALDRFIHDDTAVAEALRRGFVIMKVNYSEENQNQNFLAVYPEVPGYPHLFVLESDGTFLHAQFTGDLEEGKSYSNTAFLAFLAEWMPAP